MTHLFAHVLTAILVSSAAMAEGTRLTSDGKVLFQASEKVTFGASYGDRAVRATVAAPAEAKVELRVDKTPRNVFLGGERLAADTWRFADGMVALTVPAGTAEIQIRFDDVTSLKPVELRIPVVLLQDGRRQPMAEMTVTVNDGGARGSLPWAGPAGFYQAEPKLKGQAATGVEVGVREAPAAEFAGRPAFYLEKDSLLAVTSGTTGFVRPLDALELTVAAACGETRKADRKTLDWEGSVVVEGEAFARQGGGEIVVSKEHRNTHGGACAYSWAKPGHWLEWDVEIPKAGAYMLTIVGASQESTILRSATLDDKPLPGAGVLRMAGTGGWGRSNPDEWQPFQPVDAAGQPLRLELDKGRRILRLTNLVGQHFNVDAILFTPAP